MKDLTSRRQRVADDMGRVRRRLASGGVAAPLPPPSTVASELVLMVDQVIEANRQLKRDLSRRTPKSLLGAEATEVVLQKLRRRVQRVMNQRSERA